MKTELMPQFPPVAYGRRRMDDQAAVHATFGRSFADGIVPEWECAASDFRTTGLWLKRLFDISVSSVIILVSSPLIGLLAIGIKLGSRGPVFHNVFRTGRGFRVFKLYRFRTTRAGVQRMAEDLHHIRGHHDGMGSVERGQTTLGRMLCATGVDKLPMFFNVWRGDLSLVGVRALPLHEASGLFDDDHAARFEVPAGIWGPLADHETKGSLTRPQEILEAELAYAGQRSFRSDLGILWKAWRPRNAAHDQGARKTHQPKDRNDRQRVDFLIWHKRPVFGIGHLQVRMKIK